MSNGGQHLLPTGQNQVSSGVFGVGADAVGTQEAQPNLPDGGFNGVVAVMRRFFCARH